MYQEDWYHPNNSMDIITAVERSSKTSMQNTCIVTFRNWSQNCTWESVLLLLEVIDWLLASRGLSSSVVFLFFSFKLCFFTVTPRCNLKDPRK